MYNPYRKRYPIHNRNRTQLNQPLPPPPTQKPPPLLTHKRDSYRIKLICRSILQGCCRVGKLWKFGTNDSHQQKRHCNKCHIVFFQISHTWMIGSIVRRLLTSACFYWCAWWCWFFWGLTIFDQHLQGTENAVKNQGIHKKCPRNWTKNFEW